VAVAAAALVEKAQQVLIETGVRAVAAGPMFTDYLAFLI
jgi:hypothetical protein